MEVWQKGKASPLPSQISVRQDELEGQCLPAAPGFPKASAAIPSVAPARARPASSLFSLRGPRIRGRGCSCLPLAPQVLRAAPQRQLAAPLGPCRGRASFLVWPLQTAGWALEKAGCSEPEHREPQTDRESNHPRLQGRPELADRRDQGRAGLAGRGHSRGLFLWGQRIQER